jgi:methionyl-tRNA synthetase
LSRQAVVAKTPQASADLLAQLAHVLWHLLEALRVAAILLAPFLPEAAREIVKRLGVPTVELDDLSCARFGAGARFRLIAGAPLFPRVAPSLSGARASVA